MFLVRLIYASRKSKEFQSDDIEQILQASRHHNAKLQVTGLLCFNRKYFLQCLEGSRDSVNQIYNKVLNDPRHQEMVLLKYEEIAQREFEAWSMAYIPESRLTAPANLRYSGFDTFEPFQMSGDSAYLLLRELKKTLLSL